MGPGYKQFIMSIVLITIWTFVQIVEVHSNGNDLTEEFSGLRRSPKSRRCGQSSPCGRGRSCLRKCESKCVQIPLAEEEKCTKTGSNCETWDKIKCCGTDYCKPPQDIFKQPMSTCQPCVPAKGECEYLGNRQCCGQFYCNGTFNSKRALGTDPGQKNPSKGICIQCVAHNSTCDPTIVGICCGANYCQQLETDSASGKCSTCISKNEQCNPKEIEPCCDKNICHTLDFKTGTCVAPQPQADSLGLDNNLFQMLNR